MSGFKQLNIPNRRLYDDCRRDYVVMGGITHEGNWNNQSDGEDDRRILQGCIDLEPSPKVNILSLSYHTCFLGHAGEASKISRGPQHWVSQWRTYIVKFWTPPGPISFIFMQFLATFGQIIGWCPVIGCPSLREILDPPLLIPGGTNRNPTVCQFFWRTLWSPAKVVHWFNSLVDLGLRTKFFSISCPTPWEFEPPPSPHTHTHIHTHTHTRNGGSIP